VTENPMKRSSSVTRRAALGGIGGALASSALLDAQQDPFRDHSRVPGMDELTTVTEFEAVAFAKMARDLFMYMAHGGEGEFTLRRNREAYDWVELVPKGVMDVGTVQTATNILGTPMAFPIMTSPTSAHIQLHREAEAATYRGSQAASNTPYIVSDAATLPKEKIAAAATGPLWFQLYPKRDMDVMKAWTENVQALGGKAVVMTVDQQATYYERTTHDRHLSAGGPSEPGAGPRGGSGAVATGGPRAYRVPDYRLWYNWKYAEQVKAMLKVPMVAKGILTGEDAKLCIEHGFDAVYVSNHGGRSMDYGPSTLEVLPEIVDAVKGRVPVLFDSGIRSGSDILKALALGANAVCIGRGARSGLAAYGAAGVQRIHEILQGELVMAMAQTGRPTLASIDRTLVKTNFR
jgi:4-hydroxymandelate oxidase